MLRALLRMAAVWATAAVAVAVAPSAASADEGAQVDCQVAPSSGIPAEYADARTYADIIGNGGCELIWSYLSDRLVDGRYEPASEVTVVWAAEGPPGWVDGDGVHLNYQYIQSIWDRDQAHDWGLAYHELAHAIQAYPPGEAAWVTEGLADWARYDAGQPPPGHDGTPGCERHHYSEGYECAAAFLDWIDRHYEFDGEHSVIPVLNAAYHNGWQTPPAVLLETLTGENIDDLWAGCLGADCSGGQAEPSAYAAADGRDL